MNLAARPLIVAVILGLLAGCSESPRELQLRKEFEGYKAKAEHGDALAQCNLGNCYYEGIGVAKDYVQAVSWYRKAAEQGDARAQNNLGVCYDHGEGVAQDFVQAVSWFRKAVEQEYVMAQVNLGNCYNFGRGVPKDEIEAHAYWNLVVLTQKDARWKLVELEKKLSADQIAAGQKRSKELQKEIEAKIAAKKAGK
jgi:TPR repeat protein